MLTRERAEYIWSKRGIQDAIPRSYREACSPHATLYADGLTIDEDAHVRAVWKSMPGWTSWRMAFDRIRRGKDA
jgi:hypothetical protein